MLLHLDAVQHLGAVRLPAGEAPLQRLGTCCYIHGTRGALRAPPARVLTCPPACPLPAAAVAPEPGRRGPGGIGAAAGAAGFPRRACSGDALAPGPGVLRAGRGGCSPRRALPGTRSHARRLLCHLLVSLGAGLRRRRQTEPREETAAAAVAAAAGGGGGGGAGAAPRAGGARAAQRGPGRGAAGRRAPGALPALLQCHGALEEPLGLELGLAAEGYSGREPPHPSSNFLTFELIGAPRIPAPG